MTNRGIAWILCSIVFVSFAEAQSITWEPTAGPPSVRAPAFVVTPSGALLIAQAGMIARSTDDGDTWRRLEVSDCAERLRMEEDAVLLRTCDGWFRSGDDGQRWQEHEPMRLGHDDEPVRQVVQSGASGWFALADDSVFWSGDDGATWQDAMSGLRTGAPYVSPYGLLHTPDDSVYVAVNADEPLGCTATVYSWQRDASAWRAVGNLWGCATALFHDEGHVYLGGEPTHYLFGKGGLKRWTNRSRWDTLYVGTVLSATSSGDTLYLGRPRGVSYSTDDGATWHEVSPGEHLAVEDLRWSSTSPLYAVTDTYFWPAIDPHGALLEVGVGVLRRDGDRWTRLDPGIASGAVASLVSDRDSLFALTSSGVWSTGDGGASWQPYDSTGWRYPMSFEMMQMGTEVVDRAAWGDVFVRDGWIMHLDAYEPDPQDRGWGAWSSLGEQGAKSARAVGDSVIVAVTDEGCLHRSTDRGVTWQRADEVLCQFGLVDEVVDTLWATAANGGVWRSTDEGASWDSLGVMVAGERARSLHALSGRLLFGVSGRMLHRSEDGGSTWGPLPDAPLPDGQLLMNRQGQLFLPDGETLWGSVNRGASWRRLVGNLPENDRPHALALGEDGRLFVGTEGHGVWRSAAPVVLDAVSEARLPQRTVLAPPFPNPASRGVTLSFALARPAHIRLTVYDVLGRRVAVLHDRPLPSGEHAATWSTAEVSAGTYFIRLEGAGTGQTRPIIVAH